MNANEQTYQFVVDVRGVHNGVGKDSMVIEEHALTFRATPSKARSILFEKGYYLHDDAGIFDDNGEAYMSESWKTTSETAEYNDVPERLSILMPGHMYVRMFPHAAFKQLVITRTQVPAGGRRRRSRSTRRKSHRKSKVGRSSRRR